MSNKHIYNTLSVYYRYTLKIFTICYAVQVMYVYTRDERLWDAAWFMLLLECHTPTIMHNTLLHQFAKTHLMYDSLLA